MVHLMLEGPTEGVDLVQRAMEGLLDMGSKDYGIEIASLGEVNKLEHIAIEQNALDEKYAKDRDYLYAYHIRSDDELRAWLENRRSQSAETATWMNFFLEGTVQAYLDGRISADTMGELVYARWMNQLMQAIIHEAVECQDSLSWKHWKDRQPVDVDNVETELIDILHFNVSGFRKAGMSPQAIFERYMSKNRENHDRQAGLVPGREDYAVTAAEPKKTEE